MYATKLKKVELQPGNLLKNFLDILKWLYFLLIKEFQKQTGSFAALHQLFIK